MNRLIGGFLNARKNLSGRWLGFSKEGIWIIIGQALAVIGSIVGVRLLTELMAPGVYGEVALGVTVATLVNQLSFGPLGNGVMRFYAPAKESGRLGGYLVAVRKLALLATIFIVLLGVLALGGLTIGGLRKWVVIAVFAIIYAIVSGHNTTFSSIQSAARHRATAAMHQGVESWIRFLVVIGLLLTLGVSGSVAMLGYATAAGLVLVSQYLFYRKIAKGHEAGQGDDAQWIRQIWGFSWPFAAWGIFYWAQSASDRWALNMFSSTHEVGLYSVLFQLGYAPMSMVAGMVLQFFAPILYQQAGSAEDKERNAQVKKVSRRLAAMALLLTGVACFAAWLLHDYIFKLLVASEYWRVSYLLPWIMLASGLFACGQTMGLNLLSQMRPRVMMWVTIVSSLVGLALNFTGAYFMGVAGVIFAGIVFSALYATWMALLSYKAHPV